MLEIYNITLKVKNMNRTNNIPLGIPNGRSTPERGWRRRWSLGCYGFSGFIGFEAFRAFSNNNPLFLFMFGFFSLFGIFQYWKEELKYLSVLGVLGLLAPALWATGAFKL